MSRLSLIKLSESKSKGKRKKRGMFPKVLLILFCPEKEMLPLKVLLEIIQ
jgi:hypothetical protein